MQAWAECVLHMTARCRFLPVWRECRTRKVGRNVGWDAECGSRVQEHCGIASNVGKTRVYNAGHGAPPPGMHELGDEVWRGNRPSGERGFTALGVHYVREWGRRRVRDEQAFLDHLPHLPDLQCAWLLLLLCGSTRANHALRNIPPDVAQPYAEARDRAICATLWACLGEEAGNSEPLASPAWAIATLPTALGGLGLQSAARTAPAAYWEAWADSLGYLGSRCPNLARACSDALARWRWAPGHVCGTDCGQFATERLPNLGCPTDNVPAPGSAGEAGPGNWPHGWQFHASRTRTNYFRERAADDPGTSPPCPAAFPVRPTGCLAYSGACGHGHHAPTQSDANRFAPPAAFALAAGPSYLRSGRPRLRQTA